MRLDVLQRIETHTEWENIIVLTHNLDGSFVESVVLPILRRTGNPTLTIFAEASCAIAMYQSRGRFFGGLGHRYRVVPVDLSPPFRFHAKAILLAARDRATLFVGSGNMSFGGWREHGEIWAEFTIEKENQDDAPAFAYFREYLFHILQNVPVSERVRYDVEEAFGLERKC